MAEKPQVFCPDAPSAPFERDPNDPYAAPEVIASTDEEEAARAEARAARYATIAQARIEDPDTARRLIDGN